jgi:two-component system, cell cycle sensor histidine kinase and response regulator CckA
MKPPAAGDGERRSRGFRTRVFGAFLGLLIIAMAGIVLGLTGRNERNERLEAFSTTWQLSEFVDDLAQDMTQLHRQFTLLSQSSPGDGYILPPTVKSSLLDKLVEVEARAREIDARDLPWLNALLEKVLVEIRDWRFVVEQHDVDYVAAISRLATTASPRAEELLEQDFPTVHEQLNQQLKRDQQAIKNLGEQADRTLVLALLVPLLFFALISVMVVRRVLSSLNTIMTGIKTYAAGDFKHRVVIAGDDEFADAAAQINLMADQRRMALDELHQLNATLESKVEERTAELSASRESLAEAQRIAKVGSWTLELATNTLAWSDEVFRIFEIDQQRFGARFEAFLELVHPADRDMVNSAYQQSLQTRRPYLITHRLRMPDGRIKHVEERCETEYDADGKPLCSKGTVQDITEKLLAEEALRKKDIINRQVIDTALDAVVIINEQGRVEDWNSQAEKMFGWSRADMDGMLLKDTIIPHKYRDAHEAGMKHFLATGEGPALNQRLELTALHRDGTEIPIELAISPMRTGAGFTFSAFIRDLTARKEGERERERLQTQLTQAQKMEAIGRLAGGVAHDFNNMLSVIMGYTDLAAAKVDGKDGIAKHLSEIRSAAERASGVTRQLLAFARKQTVAPKLLDLNETVNGMLGMLRRLLGEHIQLDWVPTAEPQQVLMDPSQIDQILVNLCVNARESIEENGIISIGTCHASFSEEDAANRTDIQAGEYVVLSVGDNGCGMDKETLAMIFEPFFTTKGKGTGLGLPTVYGIVRQNKGFVNAYSEPGIGTNFTVYLPRAAGAVKQARTGQSTLPDVAGNNASTILVVEDEPAILNMIKDILESLGFSVLTAGVPTDALKLVEERGGDVHMLLSDVIMPEMNGKEMAEKMRRIQPGLKVLFMSGYTSDFIDKHGVLEQGVNFIQKPFSPIDLANKIRSIM